MMYLNRNGVTEQVRFYRQQPERMKYAQFDFEIKQSRREKSSVDTAVFIACLLCLVGLYAFVYTK